MTTHYANLYPTARTIKIATTPTTMVTVAWSRRRRVEGKEEEKEGGRGGGRGQGRGGVRGEEEEWDEQINNNINNFKGIVISVSSGREFEIIFKPLGNCIYSKQNTN